MRFLIQFSNVRKIIIVILQWQCRVGCFFFFRCDRKQIHFNHVLCVNAPVKLNTGLSLCALFLGYTSAPHIGHQFSEVVRQGITPTAIAQPPAPPPSSLAPLLPPSLPLEKPWFTAEWTYSLLVQACFSLAHCIAISAIIFCNNSAIYCYNNKGSKRKFRV